MPARLTWGRNPDAGGANIPPTVRTRVTQRIERFAAKHYAGKYLRLGIRFRGPLCYIDAFMEPEEPSRQMLKMRGETRAEYFERMRGQPLHLCRLRYFGDEEGWGFAFFTYSNERYSLCAFADGSFYGTPEDAFELSAMYLRAP